MTLQKGVIVMLVLVMMVPLMDGYKEKQKVVANRKYKQMTKDDAVVVLYETPQDRSSRKFKEFTELLKQGRVSVQVICVGVTCLMVEIFLGLMMNILAESYEVSEDYPMITFLVMGLLWYYLFKELKEMIENIKE